MAGLRERLILLTALLLYQGAGGGAAVADCGAVCCRHARYPGQKSAP